jgi:hypothetical protein
MISKWLPEDFLQKLDGNRREELDDFLGANTANINHRQRIVLVAEAYDFEVLIAAEWLTEEYGANVLCCRLSLAKDAATGSEYLSCSNIFPMPELAGLALARHHNQSTITPQRSDWDTALSSVNNQALVNFFRTALANNQEHYLAKRELLFRITGTRRWFMAARREYAYVWQFARFDGDLDFWKEGLSEPTTVCPVNDSAGLRPRLVTVNDFQFFKDAASQTLLQTNWAEEPGDEGSE